MSDIKERLREAVQKLRRTPMAIAYISPMLTDAADHIATLEQESAANLQRALVAEKSISTLIYKLEKSGAKIPMENNGTIESAMNGGLSIALMLVMQERDRIAPDTSTQEVG